MDKKLVAMLKETLEKERVALKKELESFATEDKRMKNNWDARYPNRENGNMEEEADETQEYDNLLSLEHSLELKFKDVNSALEKIAQGAYGKCEKCGREIEEERLLAYPGAKLCIGCNR